MRRALPLNERTLATHGTRVPVPAYDRAALTRGVVHISVGSFHRAHQAVYFDALANRGLGDGWAITGVNLHRRAMQEALTAQDGLYTVLTRGLEDDEARVIGIITRQLFAPEQQAELLSVLTHADTRLVTLTLTPNGYVADGAPALIAEALHRRRRLGRRPFTVLSCDNLPDNGESARTAVLTAAAHRDPATADWIGEHGAFPSSMVDRITPGTRAEDRELLAHRFGIRDRWPVVTEPFSEWVIEDDFSAGRPPLEEVGVRFVNDVSAFSATKTRLLNGTHCALGYLGTLAGVSLVSDAVADPVFAAYVRHLMEEVAPLLPRPQAEVARYAAAVRTRLANPVIADPLTRLCRNGSMKVPRHLLTSIAAARGQGRPHAALTLAVAAWCRYLRGGCPGSPAVIDDPDGERLRALARAGGSDPRPLLGDEPTFGSLGRDARFAAALARDLAAFEAIGVRATVAQRVLRDELAAARAA